VRIIGEALDRVNVPLETIVSLSEEMNKVGLVFLLECELVHTTPGARDLSLRRLEAEIDRHHLERRPMVISPLGGVLQFLSKVGRLVIVIATLGDAVKIETAESLR
jgi:hypothetical protein